MEWFREKRRETQKSPVREKTLAAAAFLLGALCLLTFLAAFGGRETSSAEVLSVFETVDFSKVDCHISRVDGGNYLELEGRFQGELSREEQRILTETLLDKMGAKQVAGIDEDAIYAVYAYAKSAGETKTLPEGEVNLNLAVTYDELQDETVFHLGCPILLSDW